MKSLISIFCLFYSLGVHSQVTSGEVLYKVTQNQEAIDAFVKEMEEGGHSPFKQLYQKVMQALPYITYSLKFNNQQALFSTTASNYMASDSGVDINLALGLTRSKGVYYADLKEAKTLIQFDNYGELWLVEEDIKNFDWKITNESLTILDYTCYKAIGVLPKLDPKAKSTEVVAWFAPELPLAYGPLNFGSLPGLILCLEYANYIYSATNLIIDTKAKSIKKPNKGKYFNSFSVYQSELEKIAAQYKKLYQTN